MVLVHVGEVVLVLVSLGLKKKYFIFSTIAVPLQYNEQYHYSAIKVSMNDSVSVGVFRGERIEFELKTLLGVRIAYPLHCHCIAIALPLHCIAIALSLHCH